MMFVIIVTVSIYEGKLSSCNMDTFILPLPNAVGSCRNRDIESSVWSMPVR